MDTEVSLLAVVWGRRCTNVFDIVIFKKVFFFTQKVKVCRAINDQEQYCAAGVRLYITSWKHVWRIDLDVKLYWDILNCTKLSHSLVYKLYVCARHTPNFFKKDKDHLDFNCIIHRRRIYADADASLQLKGFYDEVASPLLAHVIIKYSGTSARSVTKQS